MDLKSSQVGVVTAVNEVALQRLVHVHEDGLVAFTQNVTPSGLEQAAEAYEKIKEFFMTIWES